jgi:hypothetical protein
MIFGQRIGGDPGDPICALCKLRVPCVSGEERNAPNFTTDTKAQDGCKGKTSKLVQPHIGGTSVASQSEYPHDKP